ncbi:MAG: alpha-L-fucosidase [Planctomycetota bacterium]|jgi:alpha-L-fucosidase
MCARADTTWFRKCGWGVFCHYLSGRPSEAVSGELTAEEWNRQVDAVDVEALAETLARVGAPYFFITIGQNSGFYCSPNSTYDEIVGIKPSKCSRRDLVADLYDALRPRGIGLLVYLPSGAPANDKVAVEKFQWEPSVDKSTGERTTKRMAAFQRKWEAVIRDWSLRWGRNVRGWWIDGCYAADAMYRHDDEPNFASFAAALKAGNPDSIVAFNPGVDRVICTSEHEDYTAGELSCILPVSKSNWPPRQLDGTVDEAQWHVLTFLGRFWRSGQPRFPDALVAGYTQHVVNHGGVVTWDVPITDAGSIPAPFIRQLEAIGKAIPRRR